MRSTIFLLMLSLGVQAQSFHFVLEKDSLPNFNGLQSFAHGSHNGDWVLLGGRTDGLHRRQPPFSFLASENNEQIYVIDPAGHQVWTSDLSSLPADLEEQLQSTNMSHYQDGEYLYLVGGYAYSSTALDHITFDRLIRVHLPSLVDSIKNNGSITGSIKSIQDTLFQITGGQLGKIGDNFLLVGGNTFTGRYNPMNGPSFVQKYSNSIRRFQIVEENGQLVLDSVDVTYNSTDLHRRDYNLSPYINGSGDYGYMLFSGVFQYMFDLPYHDIIEIGPQNYSVVPSFEQLLNQYHSARLPMYRQSTGEMWTVFFGGIGHYVPDGNGNFIVDDDVPFVKSISTVGRVGNQWQEYHIGDMPDYLGAAAEFIPGPLFPEYATDILDMGAITDTTLVGYVVGGIQSSLDKIFWINTGVESWTNPYIYRVYLIPSAPSAVDEVPDISGKVELEIWPNPSQGKFRIRYKGISTRGMLYVHDVQERVVWKEDVSMHPLRSEEMSIDLSHLSRGTYLLSFRTGSASRTLKLIIE